MENPIKMDDLGVPYFWKHPYLPKLMFLEVPTSLDLERNITNLTKVYS